MRELDRLARGARQLEVWRHVSDSDRAPLDPGLRQVFDAGE
jgi:hypothetical protein